MLLAVSMFGEGELFYTTTDPVKKSILYIIEDILQEYTIIK